MTNLKLITLLALLVGFVPTLAATNALANNAEADSIITRIQFLQNDIQELSSYLPRISGEDSLIIQNELEYSRVKTLDQVFLLINLLADNKDSGPIRPQEQAILDMVSPKIIHAEDIIVRNLKLLRTQRKLTQASLKADFEANLAELISSLVVCALPSRIKRVWNNVFLHQPPVRTRLY